MENSHCRQTGEAFCFAVIAHPMRCGRRGYSPRWSAISRTPKSPADPWARPPAGRSCGYPAPACRKGGTPGHRFGRQGRGCWRQIRLRPPISPLPARQLPPAAAAGQHPAGRLRPVRWSGWWQAPAALRLPARQRGRSRHQRRGAGCSPRCGVLFCRLPGCGVDGAQGV